MHQETISEPRAEGVETADHQILAGMLGVADRLIGTGCGSAGGAGVMNARPAGESPDRPIASSPMGNPAPLMFDPETPGDVFPREPRRASSNARCPGSLHSRLNADQ